jgi:hypothetical protein
LRFRTPDCAYLHQLALIAPEKNLPAGPINLTHQSLQTLIKRHPARQTLPSLRRRSSRSFLSRSTNRARPRPSSSCSIRRVDRSRSSDRSVAVDHFDQFRPKKNFGPLRAKKSAMRSLHYLAPFFGFLRLFADRISACLFKIEPSSSIAEFRDGPPIRHSSLVIRHWSLAPRLSTLDPRYRRNGTFETKSPRVKMRRLVISNLRRKKWYSTISRWQRKSANSC